MEISTGDIEPPAPARAGGFSLLFVILCSTLCATIVACLGVVALHFYAGAPSGTARPVAMEIDEAVAKLDLKPRTIELVMEKALRLRQAVERGDYAAANGIAQDVLAKSAFQDWRLYPFPRLIASITGGEDSALVAHLDAWAAQDKRNDIPLLIRAQYYHDLGWLVRGHGFTKDTEPDRLVSFQKDMATALADIDAAIRLNDRDPYSFYLKLRILRDNGLTPQLKDAFDQGIAKYPGYYKIYELFLDLLQPRWGGSVAAMYAFVDTYAGKAPEYSPLKMLYVALYRDLLSTASLACTSYTQDKDKMGKCMTIAMSRVVAPRLENQVMGVLKSYDHFDKRQFDFEIADMLSSMLKTVGGDMYAGAVLQLAASAMHSDTQLSEDKPGHNDYVIDQAAGISWYHQQAYENAETKFKEALRDTTSEPFRNEEDKDLTLATLYQDLGDVYNQTHQYADLIAVEKASAALGGKAWNEKLICYGYYMLKQYDAAVQACTEAINRKGDLESYYWRGLAYQDRNRLDDALADFKVVAGSNNFKRTGAAIEMSAILSFQQKFRKALNVLETYRYLYDPKTQGREDIAVSYNNLCYNRMQLGDLKAALDACNQSLEFGSLPDAYRKQQELIKRLKTP